MPFGLCLHGVLNKIKHSCQFLYWSPDDAMINVFGVSCLWLQTHICRQNQETPAQKDCTRRLQSFSQLLEGALEEGINCSFLHGGMRWDLSEKPKGAIQGKSSASTNAKNSQLRASYIIFNMSDHVRLLQHVEHLSLTSLLQYLSLHKYLRIGGGGKRREPSFLHRNFHALGSVN